MRVFLSIAVLCSMTGLAQAVKPARVVAYGRADALGNALVGAMRSAQAHTASTGREVRIRLGSSRLSIRAFAGRDNTTAVGLIREGPGRSPQPILDTVFGRLPGLISTVDVGREALAVSPLLTPQRVQTQLDQQLAR